MAGVGTGPVELQQFGPGCFAGAVAPSVSVGPCPRRSSAFEAPFDGMPTACGLGCVLRQRITPSSHTRISQPILPTSLPSSPRTACCTAGTFRRSELATLMSFALASESMYFATDVAVLIVSFPTTLTAS